MITVLFASYNGADTLPAMLEACCVLDTDGLRYKLVAVDNGSTDETPRILESYRRRLPLEWFTERRRGKNVALNAALARVEGEIVVLTDDDIVPRPDWLLRMQTAFAACPEADVVGGRVEPRWPAPPQPWLLQSVPLSVAYAATPAGLRSGAARPTDVWGCNMAVRAALFRAGHRFNEAVGPDGTTGYAMGSETEFVRRMHMQGFRLWHCADAVVQHVITPQQMTQRWLCGRAYRFGRGQVRFPAGGEVAAPARRIFGVPGYVLVQAAQAAAAFVGATVTRDRAARVAALWEIAYQAGVAREVRSRLRAASPRQPSAP